MKTKQLISEGTTAEEAKENLDWQIIHALRSSSHWNTVSEPKISKEGDKYIAKTTLMWEQNSY